MKILVPTSIELDLSDLTNTGDSVVSYDPKAPLSDDDLDAEMLVVWQNSPENLRDAAARLNNLRLAQSLAAGPDAVVSAGFAPSVQIASGRSLHDGPVAEHSLALVLAAVRRLDELLVSQQNHEWNTTVNKAQTAPQTRGQHTLNGAAVTIWGFGSIASRLAPMLRLLGAEVTGVASSEGERYGFPVVAAADAHSLLGGTDILISLLPATAKTIDTFDAALLASLKPGAIFVNVGRGATVDEDALVEALRSGTLRVAALDVTKAEPLPAESALWDAPNIILTPHVAGNRPQHSDVLVRANIEALRSNAPITNAVDR